MEKQTVTSEPNTVIKIWTAVFGLKNNETHSFVVSEEDKGRLEELVAGQLFRSGHIFFCFDCGDRAAAINISQIQSIRMVWDLIRDPLPESDPDGLKSILDGSDEIKVWFAGENGYVEFGALGDINENNEPVEEYDGELSAMLREMEEMTWNEFGGFVSFPDEDNEMVYLQPSNIAVLTIPHRLLAPEIESTSDADDEAEIVPEAEAEAKIETAAK